MSRRVVEEIEFARKRPRLEKLAESRTVSKLTELIGRGSLSVAGACDLARAVVEDHELPAGAIKTFASLGSSGKHPQNCERDLHRWLRGLYGLVLEPYVIQVKLQIDGFRSKPVSIRVLLPHEILHALAVVEAPFFFDSVVLGNLSGDERVGFWKHVQSLPPWADHPVINDEGMDLSRLVGFTVHGDGAIMKRDDECFVWSVASCFEQEGAIKDPLLLKFPVAIIPERHMLSHEAAGLMRAFRFQCQLVFPCRVAPSTEF